MMRTLFAIPFAVLLVLISGADASAQRLDLTVFAGAAYPTYDEQLILRAGTLSVPGVDVTSAGNPELKGSGGAVFGAALTFELGIFGIEGRYDSVGAAIDFTGARYDLRGVAPPFEGVTATISAPAGSFDIDRISIFSANVRLRTPGPIGLIASGGASYLPDITVSGTLPINVNAPQIPPLGVEAALALRATPGQSSDRWGLNGGVGLRIGGRVAVIGEVRAFYFKEYELRFRTANGPAVLDDLLADANPVRFHPVFVNAQGGVSFRF